MPGRAFSSRRGYRYGFNGKDLDSETRTLDYGMRVFAPAIGKFLSVDPLTRDYAELTPYQFASNSPIEAVDVDGLEKYHYSLLYTDKGEPFLKLDKVEHFVETVRAYQYWDGNGKIHDAYAKMQDPYREYYVTYSWKTYAQTEVVAVPYVDHATAKFDVDPTRANIDDVVETVNDEVQSHQTVQMLRGAISAGARRSVGRISTRQPGATERGNAGAAAAHNGNASAANANKAPKRLTVASYKDAVSANKGKGLNADHIPSFAAVRRMREQALGRPLTKAESSDLRQKTLTLTIDAELHRQSSQTFGGRNTARRQAADSQNPVQAIRDNVNAYRSALLEKGYSNEEIDNAIKALTKPYQKSSTQSP